MPGGVPLAPNPSPIRRTRINHSYAKLALAPIGWGHFFSGNRQILVDALRSKKL